MDFISRTVILLCNYHVQSNQLPKTMINRFDLLVDENEDPEEATAKLQQLNVNSGAKSSSPAKAKNAAAAKRTSNDSRK